jgi:Uma2 family endonuclease
MSVGQALVTAEEFTVIAAESDHKLELVKGEVIDMTRPGVKHGGVCAEVARQLGNWAVPTKRGRVVANDAGVQTERDPDSVRGPDVFYIRMDRLPGGEYPDGWLEIPPDLCVEVLSPHDRWPEVIEKINEYFRLGVPEVWVLDPATHEIQIHLDSQRLPTTLHDGNTLKSDRLPGFECAVSELFDGC